MAVDCYSMFPPGYCFAPNDVELIECYLKPKVNGCFNHPPGRIYEVNIYEHSPQQLIEKYRRPREKVTYFFTPRNRKYANGSRPDRAVGEIGFWKATGKDIDICCEGRIIGYKKALVYYTGTHENSIKTSWLMHEFKLNKKQLDDCVLCKIYDKTQKLSGDKRKYAGEELQVEVPMEQIALQSQQNGEHFQAQPLSTTNQNPAMPSGYLKNGWNNDLSNPLPPFPNNIEVEQLGAHLAADTMLTMASSMPPMENGWNYDFSNPLPPVPNNMEVQQPEALFAAESMLTMVSSMPPMENDFMLPMTMESIDHLIDYRNIADIISEYAAELEFQIDDPSLVQQIQPFDDPSPPKDG